MRMTILNMWRELPSVALACRLPTGGTSPSSPGFRHLRRIARLIFDITYTALPGISRIRRILVILRRFTDRDVATGRRDHESLKRRRSAIEKQIFVMGC